MFPKKERESLVRTLTATVYPKHLKIVEDYMKEHGIQTVSDAVRRILDEYVELREKYKELKEEIEYLKKQSQQLREMIMKLSIQKRE